MNSVLFPMPLNDFEALIQNSVRKVLSEGQNFSEPLQDAVDVFEAVKITGYSKATIYKLKHEGKIPCHNPAHGGRKLVFSRKELLNWLQSNEVEPKNKGLINE